MSNVYVGVTPIIQQYSSSHMSEPDSSQLHEGHTLMGADDQSEGN